MSAKSKPKRHKPDAVISFRDDPKKPGQLLIKLEFHPPLKGGQMNPVQSAAMRCLTQFATAQ